MRVRLEYGRTGLEVELPDQHLVKCLGYQPVQPIQDAAAAVRRALAEPLRHAALGRTGAGTAQRLHRHLRHHPPRAQPADSRTAAGDLGGRRHRPRGNSDPRRHRPAPAEHGGGKDRDARPRDCPAVSGRRPRRARSGGPHLPGHDAPRRSGMDRLAFRRGRSQDRRRPDRAAFHGRLFRRAEAHLSRDWPPWKRSRSGMARPSWSTPTPGPAAWRGIRSTKRTRALPAWPVATSSSTW